MPRILNHLSKGIISLLLLWFLFSAVETTDARRKTKKRVSQKESALKAAQAWLKRLDKDYTLDQLKSLTILGLSGYGFATLPKEIGLLKKLTGLDLSDNKLTILPKEIGHLKKLSYLYLNANQLTALPEEIGLLTKLTELNLVGNKFSEKEKQRIEKLLPQCYIRFE